MARLVPIWLSVETAANPMLQTLLIVNSGNTALIGHGLWPDIHEKVALEPHGSSMHTLSLGKLVLVASLQLLHAAAVVARRRLDSDFFPTISHATYVPSIMFLLVCVSFFVTSGFFNSALLRLLLCQPTNTLKSV